MNEEIIPFIARSFFMGTQVAQQANAENEGDKQKEIANLLADIAEGKFTLQPTEAELRLANPDIENTGAIRSSNQQVDQKIAMLVLKHLGIQL